MTPSEKPEWTDSMQRLLDQIHPPSGAHVSFAADLAERLEQDLQLVRLLRLDSVQLAEIRRAGGDDPREMREWLRGRILPEVTP